MPVLAVLALVRCAFAIAAFAASLAFYSLSQEISGVGQPGRREAAEAAYQGGPLEAFGEDQRGESRDQEHGYEEPHGQGHDNKTPANGAAARFPGAFTEFESAQHRPPRSAESPGGLPSASDSSNLGAARMASGTGGAYSF